MELSRTKKVLLGAATLWPAVYVALLFLTSMGGAAYLELVGATEGSARFAGVLAPVFFILQAITGIDVVVLYVTYAYLVIVAFAGDILQSALWSGVIIFGGPLGQAVFYFMNVWPGKHRYVLSGGAPRPQAGPTLSPGQQKGYLAFRLVSLLPFAGTAALYTFVLSFMALESLEWKKALDEDTFALVAVLGTLTLVAAVAAVAVPRILSWRAVRTAPGPVPLEAYLTARFVITALMCTPVTTLAFLAGFMGRSLLLWFVAVALGGAAVLLAWPTRRQRARWGDTPTAPAADGEG